MVIHTYSVLILNQKTMEAFSQYQLLFREAFGSGRIGVCKWNESGTTIDTALPELENLTDDKEKWRAVIVRYIDDNCMTSFESDPRNPYDFLINKDNGDAVEESPIPLVRLTQMLGGVPPLEVKFRPEVIREAHKAPRTIYVPIEDSERELEHQRLTKMYEYDGKAPAAVLIISVRRKQSHEENIGRVWKTYKESESSGFWKKNHFPSICRFLVYDFEKQGVSQKEADGFSFWYSVMLMTCNEWDPSAIQAYRLYSLNAVMDKKSMAESFQGLADRLRDAKHSIERSIKKDMENHVCEEEDLPEYRIEIPVVLKLSKTEDCLVKQDSFNFLSKGSLSDVSIWLQQRKAAEEELVGSVRSADRVLDQVADRMRSNCSFSEDEVIPLNKYQVEDLSRETSELYQQIIEIQGKLPNEKVSLDEEVQSSAEKVRKYLLGRVMVKPALLAYLIVAFLIALSVIPAIICSVSVGANKAAIIAMYIGGSLIVVGIGAIGIICAQKIKLNKLIRRYNQCLKNGFNKLVENAGNYSAYMSGIASHSRGSSYLNISSRKRYFSETEHFLKYKHIKAINILLAKLSTWSRAYHLDVDFTFRRPETRVDVDISIAPVENKMYAFEVGKTYPVAINHSGMTMESPYRFASRIEIVREELYDDE